MVGNADGPSRMTYALLQMTVQLCLTRTMYFMFLLYLPMFPCWWLLQLNVVRGDAWLYAYEVCWIRLYISIASESGDWMHQGLSDLMVYDQWSVVLFLA